MQGLLRYTWRILLCLLVALEFSLARSALARENLPVTNLGATRVAIQGDWLVYLEHESLRGEDLNGNRDIEDAVCQVRNLSTGETRNLGLAAELIGFVSREWLILEVREDAQGEDLNRDGDLADEVVHAYEFVSGETRNLMISGTAILVWKSQMLLTIHELFAGSDLNGDGDFEDYVLHVHDLTTGETSNLGLAEVYSHQLTPSGEWAAYTVSEREGGEDLNGDGDLADEVVHTLHIPTREITNLGLAAGASSSPGSVPSIVFKGDLLVIGVSERGQGEDLNGDGDIADDVLHVHDVSVDESTNLELAGFFHRDFGTTSGEGWLVLDILEQEQNEGVLSAGSYELTTGVAVSSGQTATPNRRISSCHESTPPSRLNSSPLALASTSGGRHGKVGRASRKSSGAPRYHSLERTA